MKPKIIFKCGANERYDNGLIQHVAWPVRVINHIDANYAEHLAHSCMVTIAITPHYRGKEESHG